MGKNNKPIANDKKARIRAMVDVGYPYRKVSKIEDVSLFSISKIIKEWETNKDLVEAYKKHRADILTHDQMTYRSFITPAKLEKASAKDLELMRCMAYDKERLERGQSTENVSVLVAALDDLQKRRMQGKA